MPSGTDSGGDGGFGSSPFKKRNADDADSSADQSRDQTKNFSFCLILFIRAEIRVIRVPLF
jgi:hypothetical protein